MRRSAINAPRSSFVTVLEPIEYEDAPPSSRASIAASIKARSADEDAIRLNLTDQEKHCTLVFNTVLLRLRYFPGVTAEIAFTISRTANRRVDSRERSRLVLGDAQRLALFAILRHESKTHPVFRLLIDDAWGSSLLRDLGFFDRVGLVVCLLLLSLLLRHFHFVPVLDSVPSRLERST